MKLSLCICTKNNYSILNSCLESLKNQTISKSDLEVIVLDNSTESDEDLIKCKKICNKQHYRYIFQETLGLSEARNACIDLAKHELIYFIDDDLILNKNALLNCIAKFNRIKNLGVLGGKVSPDFQGERKPEWLGQDQLHALSTIDFGSEDIILNHSQENVWLVGANMCFRKSCLEKSLRFREDLGRKTSSKVLLSGEECDVIKAVQRKHLVLYTPDCAGKHLINKDRLKQDWFLSRSAWQSVSDILNQELWMQQLDGADLFIEKNINLLFKKNLNKEEFNRKINLVRLLTFNLLNGA